MKYTVGNMTIIATGRTEKESKQMLIDFLAAGVIVKRAKK